MRVIEKLCVAAVVAGGLSMGAGAASAAVLAQPAPSGPSFVDDNPAGSSAGLPGYLSSGLPDMGSSTGSVGSIPALGSFSANMGLCGVTSAVGSAACVPG